MKKFSEQHEWVELENGVAIVGITAYAADELGDITFVDLPELDTGVVQGEAMLVVESVKAASDIFAPVGGTVIEVNARLEEEPELINASAEKDGWIVKLSEPIETDLEILMTQEQYDEFVSSDDD